MYYIVYLYYSINITIYALLLLLDLPVAQGDPPQLRHPSLTLKHESAYNDSV